MDALGLPPWWLGAQWWLEELETGRGCRCLEQGCVGASHMGCPRALEPGFYRQHPLCGKLFLLWSHVVAPGNYRVKGIKKDIISLHQSLSVLHLHLALAGSLSCLRRCHFDFSHVGKESETLSKRLKGGSYWNVAKCNHHINCLWP